MGHKIYLEGLDLAGKSMTGAYVQHAIPGDWIKRHLTLSDGNPAKEVAHQFRADPNISAETQAALYYAAMNLDIDLQTFPEEEHLLQDSLMLARSIAYHRVNGTKELPRLMEALAERMPKFDKSFFLTASIDARQERLLRRMREDPRSVTKNDMLVFHNPKKFQATEDVLREVAEKYFDAEVIDTTGRPENYAANIIVDRITNIEMPTKDK